MKRVLCLYRVSSKGQVDQNDIPMQRIACREYIAQHSDWVLYDEKLEKGVRDSNCPLIKEINH